MKILLLVLLVTIPSIAQNKSYEERKASLEARKEAKRKRIEEYQAQDGIVYKVGDTLTIYGKLGLYDGVYKGTGAMEYQHRWVLEKDVRVIRLVIKKFRKETINSEIKAKAFCKGIDKGNKGNYTVYIDKASYNCEIRDCNE